MAATMVGVVAGIAAGAALASPLERAGEAPLHAPRQSTPTAKTGLEPRTVAGKKRHDGRILNEAMSSASRVAALIALARDQINRGFPVAGALLALEALSNATDGARLRAEESQLGAVMAVLEAGLRASRERALLSGHEGAVYCVAVSPDGEWLVTGSADKTARIWDVETGKARLVLKGHESAVRSVAVSPDGARIITGSEDLTARIWNTATGEELVRLKGHRGSVLSVAWSPNGENVFTGGGDDSVRIWNTATGEELAVLKGHHGSVGSIAVSPDGSWFVTGSDDATARVWRAGGGRAIAVLKGDEGAIYGVAISPHGARHIVTASNDGAVRIWDPMTGDELAAIKSHRDGILSLAVGPEGRLIVTGSAGNSVRIRDIETGKVRATLTGHQGAVHDVAISRDGTWLVSVSADRTARIWTTKTGEELVTLRGHGDSLTRVTMSANGNRIVTASDDKSVRVWDAEKGKELAVLKGHGGPILSIAMSEDGRRIVTGSADKSARLWDAETGAEYAVLNGHAAAVTAVAISPDGSWIITGSEDHTAGIWDGGTGGKRARLGGHQDSVSAVAVSPDGRWAATGSRDGTTRIWNMPAGRQRFVLESGAIYSLAVSSDGRRLITGSWDKTARIWDVRTGKKLATLRGHQGAIYDVAISPDRSWVVTGSGDNVARIWDAATGKERVALIGHERPVHSVAVSPDGTRIVTGSWDKTARIWDARTGRTLAVLRGHKGAVNEVALSPDGARVVTASTDNTARIWRSVPASVGDLAAYARNVVPRCLTIRERAEFGIDPTPPEWCRELQKWPYDAASELMRAKDELAAGRVEAAKALLEGLREKSPLLKQRIDELWAAHFMAAAGRHLEAGENRRAIEAYTRFLSAAEGHAAFEQRAPLAILRRGLAHYRQNSFAAARSDFRRSAALGQEKAGQWLWAAVNGTADKLYADGKTAAALVAMLGNFGRLGEEDRRYVKTVNLKTSLWRLSYAVSAIFAEIGKPVAAERRGPENQCDRLAAHGNDPFKRTRGVPFKNIKAEAAISVCTDIINTSPDEPRFYLQRARAYAKARQYEKEARDLEIAMAKGYPMAFNNMGYAYLQGNGVNMSMERGADLYLETFNRIVRCCGAPVARHLISLRKAMEREAADFRSAGQMLLDWAARLGDPDAHLSLAALHAVGELPAREALGDWRATAYYHLRIAEKLLMLAESKRSAEKAGRDAQAMASTLPETKIKSLDNAVAGWRSETFATLPPWIWK